MTIAEIEQSKEIGHMPTTMQEVMDHLIEPLRRAIGDPKGKDVSAVFGEYCGVLTKYDLSTIQEARKFFVACTPKWWPSPAEIARKCDAIRAAKHLKENPPPPPKKTGTVALADNSMDSNLGRRAAAEGWIGELWAFIRDRGDWPTDEEIKDLKLSAAVNLEARRNMLESGDKVRVDFARKVEENMKRLADLTKPKQETTDA